MISFAFDTSAYLVLALLLNSYVLEASNQSTDVEDLISIEDEFEIPDHDASVSHIPSSKMFSHNDVIKSSASHGPSKFTTGYAFHDEDLGDFGELHMFSAVMPEPNLPSMEEIGFEPVVGLPACNNCPEVTKAAVDSLDGLLQDFWPMLTPTPSPVSNVAEEIQPLNSTKEATEVEATVEDHVHEEEPFIEEFQSVGQISEEPVLMEGLQSSQLNDSLGKDADYNDEIQNTTVLKNDTVEDISSNGTKYSQYTEPESVHFDIEASAQNISAKNNVEAVTVTNESDIVDEIEVAALSTESEAVLEKDLSTQKDDEVLSWDKKHEIEVAALSTEPEAVLEKDISTQEDDKVLPWNKKDENKTKLFDEILRDQLDFVRPVPLKNENVTNIDLSANNGEVLNENLTENLKDQEYSELRQKPSKEAELETEHVSEANSIDAQTISESLSEVIIESLDATGKAAFSKEVNGQFTPQALYNNEHSTREPLDQHFDQNTKAFESFQETLSRPEQGGEQAKIVPPSTLLHTDEAVDATKQRKAGQDGVGSKNIFDLSLEDLADQIETLNIQIIEAHQQRSFKKKTALLQTAELLKERTLFLRCGLTSPNTSSSLAMGSEMRVGEYLAQCYEEDGACLCNYLTLQPSGILATFLRESEEEEIVESITWSTEKKQSKKEMEEVTDNPSQSTEDDANRHIFYLNEKAKSLQVLELVEIKGKTKKKVIWQKKLSKIDGDWSLHMEKDGSLNVYDIYGNEIHVNENFSRYTVSLRRLKQKVLQNKWFKKTKMLYTKVVTSIDENRVVRSVPPV